MTYIHFNLWNGLLWLGWSDSLWFWLLQERNLHQNTVHCTRTYTCEGNVQVHYVRGLHQVYNNITCQPRSPRKIRRKVKHAPHEGFHSQTNLPRLTVASRTELVSISICSLPCLPHELDLWKSLYCHYGRHCEPQSTVNNCSHPISRRNIPVSAGPSQRAR